MMAISRRADLFYITIIPLHRKHNIPTDTGSTMITNAVIITSHVMFLGDCVCMCVCAQRLMSTKQFRAEQFVSANLPSNKYKNRHANVLPCK